MNQDHATEQDSDMREEYDFSAGIRGRHASQLSAQEKNELLERATIQDIQVRIEHLTVQLQELEAALFTCSAGDHNEPHGTPPE